LYGHDAFLYLLRSLFSSIDFKDTKSQKDQYRITLLQQELNLLLKQHQFASDICIALEGLDLPLPQDDLINSLSKFLKLTPQHEIMIALAFAQSVDQHLRQQGSYYRII
jgi:hypothetical protein